MDPDHHYLIVARQEFTNVLVDLLYRPIYVGIKSIWDDAKENFARNEVYGRFQDKLLKIPRWNQTVISNEHRRIVDKTKCDYLDNLIRKVFVLHTQLLAATSSQPNRKISLSVPRTDDFIHKCYEMCGRAFFENPYLMEDRPGALDTRKRVRHLQESNTIIKEGICTTIRTLLPVSNLLQEDEPSIIPDVTEYRTPPSPPPKPKHERSVPPPPPPPRPVTEPEIIKEYANRWEPIMDPSIKDDVSARGNESHRDTVASKTGEEDELLKVYFTRSQNSKREGSETDSFESRPAPKPRDADPISMFKEKPKDKVDLDVNSDELSIPAASIKDAEPFFDSDGE